MIILRECGSGRATIAAVAPHILLRTGADFAQNASPMRDSPALTARRVDGRACLGQAAATPRRSAESNIAP
ncbi:MULTISPECIES: hypothetical protein [Chelatococcus]|uniref:Uncharacterized protein n=1 Tax=Chelatococcus caeni TaxID=1348468 RepID=A0A840BRC2_9HYPH|nr:MULTISPECIES: hypothetical protein [Chelatococcus]MBB4015550.1 hypothetical protein [Chelatococcus caeni]